MNKKWIYFVNWGTLTKYKLKKTRHQINQAQKQSFLNSVNLDDCIAFFGENCPLHLLPDHA
uniref:Dihydrolipoyl dehydrogenase 2ic isoform X2 n=1 Tax=Rhizophora mucronata TaxID=61149 RepID=A0A2P2L8D1_RHIMU